MTEMKKRLGLGLGMFLITILSNLSGVMAYSGNSNLPGSAIIIVFVPVMLGIIYLASKGEVKLLKLYIELKQGWYNFKWEY